jgi:hypothetical protein
MRRSFFISIFIISNINTISTSRFDIIPLIVCGRSNPKYCLSVVCMFVLGNLSYFVVKIYFQIVLYSIRH